MPIRIRAQFTSLAAGVLGSAGPIQVFRDFPNAPLAQTWYHVALANKLAGVDLSPASDDINANFSTNFNFYLGLDHQHGELNDLVTVLLHEFAHGLGFSQTASLTTGAYPRGVPGPLQQQAAGHRAGLALEPDDQRAAPRIGDALRSRGVERRGRHRCAALGALARQPDRRRERSSQHRRQLPFGTASFGPRIGSPSVTANVVAAVDAVEAAVVGATTTDGCSPFDNAAAVAGRIALIERGQCGFAVKARNASDAGAAAVIIYNNAANVNAGPANMGDDGINGVFVTVPTVSLRRVDGLAIIGELAGGVNADIGVDMTILAGADALGRARVYAPFPVAGGSSISHFDTVAFRNLLMEPAINPDLRHKLKVPFDLTLELLRDVGWTEPDIDGDSYPDDEDCNPSLTCGRPSSSEASTRACRTACSTAAAR